MLPTDCVSPAELRVNIGSILTVKPMLEFAKIYASDVLARIYRRTGESWCFGGFGALCRLAVVLQRGSSGLPGNRGPFLQELFISGNAGKIAKRGLLRPGRRRGGCASSGGFA